jgi:putative iron-regulated protein
MRGMSFRLVVGLFPLFACCASGERPAAPADLDAQRARRALESYASIASATYADALHGVRALQLAIDGLLAAPSDGALEAARKAWLEARVPYAQSEVFRFYDGPIDRFELLINTWPIDENFVEGEGAGERGLIDDPDRYPVLDAARLVALNAQAGETSISTGYHVIEFLLWGRDQSSEGPGQRAATDFATNDTRSEVRRRRAYLKTATELLLQHLGEVEWAWRQREGSYRAQFLALPARAALGLALRGMGTLSGPELAGERLTAPYETKDQENEHSCFSDSTQADILHDAVGVQNVCEGKYRRVTGELVQGPGICDLLQELAPELAKKLRGEIATSVSAARALPNPFDRALLEHDEGAGRRAIKRAIVALELQAETLARAAALLGLGLHAERATR